MKPSIPKGTRDFGPIETARRNYIFQTIREVYTLHGYSPIETPAMENLSTLMGKYGEEGDKLLYRVLNSGDFLQKLSGEVLAARDAQKMANYICEKGLRYDLTVPFARYVVQHREELQLPFKRYQIQPVWRADRPQKGRYREFYQCDADIVGSDSLLNEVELVQIIDEVFRRFRIRVRILLNNRKILTGIAEILGAGEKIIPLTVAMDKLEKVGGEVVEEELRAAGFGELSLKKLQPILHLSGTNSEKLQTMRQVLADSPTGQAGLDEVEFVLSSLDGELATVNPVEFDLTLARGLNYYTGCIFEVKAQDVPMGSITGGGRYDNLTGIFGMPGLSGVGISFGADRIYDVLEQLDLYPESASQSVQLLFLNFGSKEVTRCLELAKMVRQEGVSAEVYPDQAKMKKQMSYANARNIPYVAFIGEDELRRGVVTLKDMRSGEQREMPAEELVKEIQ